MWNRDNVGSLEITNDESDLSYINLVIKPSPVENEVMFIRDLNLAFKKVVKNFDKKKLSVQKLCSVHICKKCLTGYVKKARFESHVESCVNIKSIQYNFKNADVESFHYYFRKFNSHPFDIYYDLETTTGNENDKNMKLMSYVYCLAFNNNLKLRDSSNSNCYVHRSKVQSINELADYEFLPDFIFMQKTKEDVTLLKKSINDIILNKTDLALAHHLTLEIRLIIKWTKSYFQKFLMPKFNYLSEEEKSSYRKNNSIDKCCVCQFKFGSSDAIPFIFKKDYLKQTEALKTGHQIKKII